MSEQTSQPQGQPQGKRRRKKAGGGNRGPIGRTYQAQQLQAQQLQAGPNLHGASPGGKQGGTPSAAKQPVLPKGPPPARKITKWTPPASIVYGTAITIGDVKAQVTGAGGDPRLEFPMGELQVGQTGPNLKIVAPGDGVNWTDGFETATVKVTPAPRTIKWTPPASIVYGTAITIGDVKAQVTGAGGDPRLEFPMGELQVGQTGPNLKIVAPGDGANWTDGFETATVKVTPAPRTITAAPLAKPVLLNTPLTVEMFAAVPSAGPGAVVISEPAGKTAATFPKQRVVLNLAAAGNFLAAPPVQYDIDVELPDRQFDWTPPAQLVYLTPLTPASLGVKETDAVLAPLASDPPGVGPLDVTITVPGDGKTCRDGVRTRTLQITPAARKPVIANKTAVVRLGQTLTAASFGATASLGTAVPIVTSPTGPLTQVEKALSVTISFTPDANFADTAETLQVVVAKGLPVLTWTASPDAVVKKTKLAATLLNAQLSPPPLAATDIEYDPPAGTSLETTGLQLLLATFPGNASFLPAGPAAVRLTVCETQSAAKGANAMQSNPDAIWHNKPNSPKFAEWDAQNSPLKAKAVEVMNNIKTMDMGGMRQYLNGLPNVVTRRQQGDFPEEIWKVPPGVQVRLKPRGSENSNGKAEFMVEVLKNPAQISAAPGDIAFKVTLDGKPSPKTPGEVTIPAGQELLPGGQVRVNLESFASGAMTANHLRPLDRPPPRLIEWDLPQNTGFIRGTELFATVPRAIADVEVLYRSSSLKKDLKFGDPCVVNLGDSQFTVEAKAQGYKTEKRVLKMVARRQ